MTARLIGPAAALTAVTLLVGGSAGRVGPAIAPDDKNLLVNGSFEEGVEPTFEGLRHKPLDEDSTDIKGWVVTRGQIDYVEATFKAADGERSIDLHGSPGFGGVMQAFKTKKGQKYRVTLSVACSPARQEGTATLGVRAAGKKTKFAVAVGNGGPDWEEVKWEFVAVADETSLEIHATDTTEPNCGPLVDKVSVVAVKE